MGNYDDIKSAKVMDGGVYFEEGLYLVRVDAVKEGQTRKRDEFFVVEATILESTSETLRAGASVSWLVMLKQDAALSNIKQFSSVATDISPDEVDGPGIELLVSEKNPLRGTVLGVEATLIQTRAGNPFTKVIWRSADRIKEKLATAKKAAASKMTTSTLRTPG